MGYPPHIHNPVFLTAGLRRTSGPSFFLIRVPERDAEDDKPARPASTLFPRYHQSRLVRRVAEDITAHFATAGDIGKKYLADHSAGSGKTLSICWLADRLHSLFKPGTNEKLVDITFILTDRKSLDTNIREDVDKFTHLKDVVGIAKKAEDLPRFLQQRKSIIVTTQQKFAWVLEEIQRNPELKKLRVAFLIDEAHRSQDGQMGAAIRLPFRKEGEPDEDAPEDDPEEQIARVIREHDLNQLFVAFTATPAPATVSMFGQPFDSYTEAEAIAEGYIVDVAASIISYKTLYHLHCPVVPKPDEEKLYPKGVVSRALQNVAFQDDGLIQYKAEVMLRIFEKDVKPLIGGRAKAMIVTSSRVAGLRYFNIIKEKLKERGADYKVLYAFSDFVHPETNAAISEHAVNELQTGELIEDRFEGDDYRIMVVANKFQTGFDQPLLAGMFLDKPVLDRNAVQTVSRLNRCHPRKKDCGGRGLHQQREANPQSLREVSEGHAVRAGGTGSRDLPEPVRGDSRRGRLHPEGRWRPARPAQERVGCAGAIPGERPADALSGEAHRLERAQGVGHSAGPLRESFHFLTCFFTYPAAIQEFATFAEYVGPQLIKVGTVSDLMQQIRATVVTKGGGAISGRDDQRRPGETPAGQRKRRRRPGAGEGLRAGCDRADPRQVRHHGRGGALYQTGDGREDRRPGHPHDRPGAPRQRHLPRRPVSRTGQRSHSGDLRCTRPLRRTRRPEIHRHRRHLRHHGGDRHPDPFIPGCLRPWAKRSMTSPRPIDPARSSCAKARQR